MYRVAEKAELFRVSAAPGAGQKVELILPRTEAGSVSSCAREISFVMSRQEKITDAMSAAMNFPNQLVRGIA